MSLELGRVLDKLRHMDEYEFEHLVAELWQMRGWATRVTSGSNDRGIDVVAEKSSPFYQKQLIQAKRYAKDSKISSPDIQQYSSLRHQEDDVDAVVIVTTSSFTSQAKRSAKDLNVKLIDGSSLYQMAISTGGAPFLSKYIDLQEKHGRGENSEDKDESLDSNKGTSPFKDESMYDKVSPYQGYVDSCPKCNNEEVWFAERASGRYLKCAGCGETWGTNKVRRFTPFQEWAEIKNIHEGLPSGPSETADNYVHGVTEAAYYSGAWRWTKIAVFAPIILFSSGFIVALAGVASGSDGVGTYYAIERALIGLWYISILPCMLVFGMCVSKDKKRLNDGAGEASPRHPATLAFFLIVSVGLYGLYYVFERNRKYKVQKVAN